MQDKNIKVMGKQAALGAILYRIARYEKSKFRSFGYWKRKDKIKLLKSLEMMKKIICLLNQEGEVAEADLVEIIYFISLNIKMFSDIKEIYLTNEWNIKLIDNAVTDDDGIKELMLNIIYKIKYNIQNRPQKYKEQIWCLLHGLHNLPRVYMSNTEETLFPPLPIGITSKEAIEYSEWYI